jgi:hypothetical protein
MAEVSIYYPKSTSVSYRVPDFTDADGSQYTDIELVVVTDSDIRDAARLAGTIQTSLEKS